LHRPLVTFDRPPQVFQFPAARIAGAQAVAQVVEARGQVGRIGRGQLHRPLVTFDRPPQVFQFPAARIAGAQAVAQVVEESGQVGRIGRGQLHRPHPQTKRPVQVAGLAPPPVAPQVNAASVVPGGQAEALVGPGEGGVVQDAFPGGDGLVQRGRVAGLPVAGYSFLSAAEVGLKLRRDGWAAEFGKGSFYPHLPAAAQEGAVLLQDVAGILVALGLGGLHQLPQQGVGFIGEQFRVGLQDATGFVPGVGLDELLEGLEQRRDLYGPPRCRFQLPIRLGILCPQPLYFPLRLLGHLPQGRFGVVAQGGGKERTRHTGQALGQPFLAPGRAHPLLQQAHQPGGLLAVLFRGRPLRRGEEQRRRGAGAQEQQRRVHLPLVPAVGAGHVVQRASADALRQVRAFGGVHDEPDFGGEGPPTLGTGQGCGLRKGMGHGSPLLRDNCKRLSYSSSR
jgi:hypothetical protein